MSFSDPLESQSNLPNIRRQLATGIRSHWVAVLAAVLACFTIIAVTRLTPRSTFIVNVVMNVDRGLAVRGVINGGAVQLVPTVTGTEHTYSFTAQAFEFSSIRIYPAEVGGAIAEIRDISVEQNGVRLVPFEPLAVESDVFGYVTSIEHMDDRVRFETQHSRASVLYSKQISFNNSLPEPWIKLANSLADPGTISPLILVAVIALGLAGLTQPGLRLLPIVVVLTLLSGWILIPWVASSWNTPPPVGISAGRSAYYGYTPGGNAAALNLTLLLGIAVSMCAAFLQRKRPPKSFESDSAPQPRRSWVRDVLVPGLILLVCLAQRLPDLAALAAFHTNRQFTPDFDSSNAHVWIFLRSIGEVPLKDFWFPYWNLYFNIGWPSEGVFYWLCMSFLTFGIFYSVYLLTNRSLLAALLALYIIYVGAVTHSPATSTLVFPGLNRLGWAPVVILFYAAIDERQERFNARHFWFGFYCSAILWIEISQILYAVPGVGVVFLFRILRNDRLNPLRVLRRLVNEFGIPTITASALMLPVFVQGRWPGFSDLYVRLGDVAHYSALPTVLTGIRTQPFTTDSVVVLLPAVFVAVGVYLRLRGWRDRWTPYSDALMAMGFCSYMLAQKHVMRPMDNYCLLASAFALLLFALHAGQSRNRTSRIVVGSVFGAMIALLIAGGAWAVPFRDLHTSPQRALASSKILMDEAIAEQVDSQTWDRDRFAEFDQELAVVEHLEQKGPPKLYVLGDQSAFYILLRQPAPYQINFYNASPIYEQERVVEWLKREQPDYVVFNPEEDKFDEVPHVVRVPLIFQEVIASYVFETTIGKYHLLRRRAEVEPIDFPFWRESLTEVIDLEQIPRLSELTNAVRCESGDEGCIDVLQVYVDPPPERPEKIQFQYAVGNDVYAFRFVLVPGERTYAIRLDRLWPWQASIGSGGLPVMIGADSTVKFQFLIVPTRVMKPTLY